MSDQYVIAKGYNGPVVAGPYANYDTAMKARSGMKRTFMMWLKRQYYWGVPCEEEKWI